MISPAIVSAVRAAGEFAYGNTSPMHVAQEWDAAGFDGDDTAAWLAARCFSAWAAASLRDLGVGPEEAAQPRQISYGEGEVREGETWGHDVANGDVTAATCAEFFASQIATGEVAQ